MSHKDLLLENRCLKYVIGSDGINKSFVNKFNGKNYVDGTISNSFMEVVKGGRRYSSSSVAYDGKVIVVLFGSSGISVTLKVKLLDDYMTFELSSTNEMSLDEVTLLNLNLSIRDNIGRILNIGFDGEFAACTLALNLQTRSYGGSEQYTNLMAKCYPRYGIIGSKIAIIGVPSNMIKKTIRNIQLNEGLPSPTLAGVWDKASPEVKKSDLFLTLSEQNVDEAIKYAKKGGFSYILDIWSTLNWGHYTLNPQSYPNGLEGQREIVRKIHAAGLKAGLLTLTTCISKNDPYVTPIPDRRLAKDGSFILADDVPATGVFLPTKEPPTGAPTAEEEIYYIGGGLDIQIDDEIITYRGTSLEPPYGFKGCIRGARGTKPARHERGSTVHHLAQMFGCYVVDADTSLLDEVTQRIADVVNECEYDMLYLDGAESPSLQGAWWYYIPKVELAFFHKLKREVLIQGASYTVSVYKGQGSKLKVTDEHLDHFIWHITSRDAETDLVVRGVKGHVDRVKLKGASDTLKNLMPAEFGWFGLLTSTPSSQATQPDEIEYVCNKCVGYDSPISLETSIDALRGNGWTPQILSILKNYEMLRLQNYFSEDEKAKLREPGAEFRLMEVSEGKWLLRPVRHVENYVRDIDGINNVYIVNNDFESSSLELRIRSLPSMADYVDPRNMTLFNFKEVRPFDISSTETGVSFRVEASQEEVKVGDTSGKITAKSSREDDLGWCECEKRARLDLSKNRGIGFWVYGDGKGEILNIQLRQAETAIQGDAETPIQGQARWMCDHYVVIDFIGWRYQEIPEPEGDRIFEYYKYTKDYYSLAARDFNYNLVISVALRLMKLPPKETITLYLSEIKALREDDLVMVNPNVTVGSKTVRFPTELQPDQCLIYKPEEGICKVYSSNGFPLRDVKAEGQLPALRTGGNQIVYNCSSAHGLSRKAQVRISMIGEK